MIRGLKFKKPKELAELNPPAEVRELRDGRLKCKTKNSWQEVRKQVYARALGHCELKIKCRGGWLPMNKADVHHVIERGLGGNKRDDRIENLKLCCRDCHREMKS